MKLWILRPANYETRAPLEGWERDPWNPWYDKAHGFIVRAETEQQAREIANKYGGDENGYFRPRTGGVWLTPEFTTCEELSVDGEPDLIMMDFANA